jgi:hypothetical protein
MEELEQNLKRPFPKNALSWRVGSTNKDKTKGMMLAYIDARDVMTRLDRAVGHGNWRSEYREVMGRLVCRIGIKMGEEWVYREDGAGDTDVEGQKGGLSDALKRAAVQWGIGRYLYELPSPWVELNEYKQPKDKDWHKSFEMPVWATPDGFDEWLAREDYSALVTKYTDSINAIRDALKEGHMSTAAEAWYELPESARMGLWKAPTKGGCFTTQERTILHSSEFRESYYGPTEGK